MIFESGEPEFVIVDGKLKEELQKAFDTGKKRFKIVLYFDKDNEKFNIDIGAAGYTAGSFRLSVN